MITNIIEQDFSTFKAKIFDVGERIETLADFYTARISNNETGLIEKYAKQILEKDTGHFIDPRIYLRQNLLALVQNSYALGIADGLTDLQNVQFSDKKTTADFAKDPNDKLQRDIQKLQRDIEASTNIVRQAKTLDSYTNTLQALQKQATTLNNTEALDTLEVLANDLESLKTNNTIRNTTRLVGQQIQKGEKQRESLVSVIQPDTQDYLIKRAIEEKLQYLQNRKSSLEETPPIVLEEDSEFFKWYAQKRLIPIANRYQEKLVNNNKEVKKIITEYTEKLNNGTITQASKGEYTDKIVKKLLSIEDSSEDKYVKKAQQNAKKTGIYVDPYKKEPLRTRPIKRVQRVVSTELAIAYNIGRLKTYMKAGIQYVTISTSAYSPEVCDYCETTAKQTEAEPIKISSLLKNAYKNKGFNKDIKPIISDLRYLPNHPHCYCFYKPHPKQDPEEKQESGGIYADPNSWKFILGAGLGVSLVFLAFALTTGRKISVPRTVPSALPIRVPQAIPEIVSDTQPQSIPVRAIPQSDLVSLPVLQKYIQNLSEQQQQDFADIIVSSSMSREEKIAALYTEAAAKGLNIEEKIGDIVDTIAQQIPLVKGVQRQFFQNQITKIDNTFAIKSKPLLDNIDKQEQRLLSITPDNPDKVTITSIRNVLRETDRKYIQNQLASIQKTEDLLLQSYKKTLGKTKPNDIEYRNELSENINKLQVYRQNLLAQQQRVQSIQQQLAALKPLNKTQLRALVSDRIARVEAALETNPQEASRLYDSLLEFLVSLPPIEVNRYAAIIRRLRDKIEPTQYKRYTGWLASFSSMGGQKYITSYKYF